MLRFLGPELEVLLAIYTKYEHNCRHRDSDTHIFIKTLKGGSRE